MQPAATILVVDDEPDICALVINCLKPVGFDALGAQSGAAMREVLKSTKVDLVILDLMLAGEDGLELLRELRGEHNLPVIILTGRGEPVDRIIGLELGADDYVAKPFEHRELIARVRNILRRAGAAAEQKDESELRFHGWTLSLPARRLTSPAGEEVVLTSAEFDLLSELARNPNRALDRDTLLETVRNRRSNPFDRSIDVHIMNLRRKIGDDPKAPQIIKTVRGVGYIFTA